MEPHELANALFEHSVDGLMAIDRDFRFTAFSNSMERMCGIAAADAIGRHVADVFPSLVESGLLDRYREALAGKSVIAEELTYVLPSGHRASYEGRYVPIYAPLAPSSDTVPEQGSRRHVVGAVAIIRDLTERRVAERTLGDQKEYFRSLIENAADVITVVDRSGLATYVSPSTERILGYAPRELVGRNIAEIAHPDDLARAAGALRAAVQFEGAAVPLESRWRHRDGSVRTLEGVSRGVRDPSGGIAVVFNARDVTERRRGEDRLAAQLATAQALATHSNLRAAAPRILSALIEILGWDFAAIWMVEKPRGALRCLDALASPSISAGSFLRATRAAEYSQGEGLVGSVLATGAPKWVADIEVEPSYRRAAEATSAGIRATAAFPIVFGGVVLGIIELASVTPCSPNVDLWAAMATLGTQLGQFVMREQAEHALDHAQERLRAAQKMEAIGRLAGGVSHDFNNLLTVILGCSNLLERQISPGNPGHSYVSEISHAAQRAASLTGQLLAFSRKQVLQAKVLDPNAVVRDMETLVRRLIGEHIDFRTAFAATGRVKADPSQLEQVILNLVLNARDAMPQGGRLSVSTSDVSIDAAQALDRDGATEGAHVRLAVSDRGSGMTREVIAHIFEPFFTTKPRGKGTGLGLATVYGIVKQSGGHIGVESELGRGTTFEVLLPRIDASLSALPPVGGAELARGSETILLVEDEDALRRLVTGILTECGYDVLSARNADQALQIFAQHRETIALLLSDLIMPGQNGRELAAQILNQAPSARVLLMSGYDETGADDNVRIAFIAKPFTATQLAARVREVLNRLF